MNLLIVAHNVNSAGITSQTQNLIEELKNREDLNCKIILPDHSGFASAKKIKSNSLKITFVAYPKNKIIRVISRVLYELFYIPVLIIKNNPKSVLALANYLPFPILFRKKIILIRHPYLLKKELSQGLPFVQRLKEKLTRLLLRLTIFTTDLVIVQSDYMKDNFQKAYKNVKTLVLPNPLSNAFTDKNSRINSRKSDKEHNSTYLFYPSRFYPHKNHIFINKLVEKYYKELEALKVKIKVTLGGESLNYLSGYEKELFDKLIQEFEREPYNKIITNIGELNQPELIKYYQNSAALFFPSSEETFGNGLIEGMFFKLPILVPKLDYAMIICGNAGIYFDPDDVDSAFDSIKKIVLDPEFSKTQSILSEKRFSKFILTNEWIDILLKEINSLYSKQ